MFKKRICAYCKFYKRRCRFDKCLSSLNNGHYLSLNALWEYLNFQNRDQNNKGFKSKKEEKNQQISTERKYEFQSVCK